jgi:cysteine-rich repeat protein
LFGKEAAFMRRRIALSAVTIGVLVACGPHDVDLGGGSGGQGDAGEDGVGGSFQTGGVGGSYAGQYAAGGTGAIGSVGGSGGVAEQYCGDGVVQYPEECDDPTGLECPLDCRIDRGVGGTGAYGGSGGAGGTGAYGGVGGAVGVGGGPAGGVCGDGIVNYEEWCDDGNNVDGDGCTAECRLEAGGVGGGPATGGAGGIAGGFSTGGGPAAGGSGGYAGGGPGSCVTEVVVSPDGCADNDVLLGQGYERCQALRRSLTSVRFSAPCDDYASYAVEIDCCERTGAAGGGGTGGAGGGSVGGVGGSG